MTIILGTAHTERTPGKCSPDGSVREWTTSRALARDVYGALTNRGHSAMIDLMDANLPAHLQQANWREEQKAELRLRCNLVNRVCNSRGKENVLYVAMHLNAAGSDGQWHNAHGWSVFVAPTACTASRRLAEQLHTAAIAQGMHTLQPTPQQCYWQKSLYVLRHTLCPAVLTENLFMDNHDDMALLATTRGWRAIVDLHVSAIEKFLSW